MNIINTASNSQQPMWTNGINSRAIEQHELEGQQQLVNSSVLPVNETARIHLETLGVVYGEPVDGDPLFVHVTLPEGWKKRAATSHSMWRANCWIITTMWWQTYFTRLHITTGVQTLQLCENQ